MGDWNEQSAPNNNLKAVVISIILSSVTQQRK